MKKNENKKFDWFITGFTDILSLILPGLSSVTKGAKVLVAKGELTPVTFIGAEELYLQGLRMIGNAKEEITNNLHIKRNFGG